MYFLRVSFNSKTQWGGVGVLQNFQNIFYSQVGITGNYAELIAGYYGFMGLFGQFINLVLVAGKLSVPPSKLHWCITSVVLTTRLPRSDESKDDTLGRVFSTRYYSVHSDGNECGICVWG